jgi:bis(5'-nucleosyl)-tetraphosphatase (symmetrical)
MSHYVIGDIQGCHDEFRQLLELIGFSATQDRLWLVGDLVNRGPDSLGVMRTVMGWRSQHPRNHDFHLSRSRRAP